MSARALGDARCKDCPANREPDRSRCSECAERHRRESSATSQERRARGLCVTCGAKAARGKRYCSADLIYYAARNAAQRAAAQKVST